MGDYLRTILLEPTTVKNGRSSMRVGSVVKRENPHLDNLCRLHFELPLEVYLNLGVTIDFYCGHYRTPSEHAATEGVITHEDYISARVYRGNQDLFNFNSEDMQLLELVRRKEDAIRESVGSSDSSERL